MENKTVLKCNKICKNFGKKRILTDVSFEVDSGDILGFIGPNGAGKTTTIKLILGLNKIDSGNILINDLDIEKDFEKAIMNVGAIVENPDLYMYLSGYDNLKLIKNMYKNISDDDVNNVIKQVKLEERIKDKVSKYSLGMRQRLGIAQALLHNPTLLILDEPTNGLDPEGIKELRDLLKKLAKEKNMAILISSHNLSELESFCNKICIIQNGKIVEVNNVDKIKQKKKDNKNSYIFKVNSTKNVNHILSHLSIIDNKHFNILLEEDEVPNIINKLVENKILIYEVKKESISLEDAFLKKTGGNKID